MNTTYRLESFHDNQWIVIHRGKLGYLQGFIDARKDYSPRSAYRIISPTGKTVEELAATTEVAIGMVAGWPTAEQYEAAAGRALERAAAIRAEQAKRTKSPTVIKDLQGTPLDLRDVEVETLILNATPAQRKHLKHIGRQAIRGMLGMEDESTATGTEIRAGIRLVAQESADNLKKHLP